MRLTRVERRAVNQAVAAEIREGRAELDLRLAELRLENARAATGLAMATLHLRKIERWARSRA